MDWRAMPPWDALRYFAIPTETTVTNPVSGTLLVTADPKRIFIGFCGQAGSPCGISTQATGTSARGLLLSSPQPNLFLDFATYGPLVQQAWYFSGGGTVQLTVFTATLNDWPKDGDTLAAIVGNGQAAVQPTRITTAPGVGGKQGVMDYWRSKIASIMGSK